MARGADEPVAVSRHFEYKNRPYQDVYASIALAVAALILVIGGMYGAANRDAGFFHKVSDAYLAVPDHCPANALRRNLQNDSPDTPDDTLPFDAPEFLMWLAPWILGSVLFSVLMGVLLVHLFRTNARRMINVAVGLMLGTWAVYAVVALISGALVPMGFALGGLALYGFLFYLWSDKFPLMAQLLSVTSTGLQQNSNIAAVPILLPVVLGFSCIPVVVFSVVAVMNGRVVQNTDAVQYLPDGICQDVDGTQVNCCTWKPDAWVPPYLFLAMLFWSWLLFLGDQIKTFVISGTIAQWYFSPVGASTSGNLTRSLKHALTSSFGSLCLSSAILTAVDYIRQMAESARNRNNNVAMMLLSCIASCIYGLIKFITKFATIRMAIVGDSFFSAATSVSGLLSRHLLNSMAVWWLPPFFLNMYVLTISIGWGVFVGVINYFAANSVVMNGVLMGLVAFLLSFIVLSFVVGLMLHIVDTVYICYALELDTQTCSKPEVHEVYNALPKPAPVPGDVVQNPDGNLAYAQPLEQQGEYTPLLGVAPPSRVQDQNQA